LKRLNIYYLVNLFCNTQISTRNLLLTDASDEEIGAVLLQEKIRNDLPIAYASWTLNKAERNYNTTEEKLLAIIWATKYFRPYVYGKRFKIVTNYKPLIWIFNVKDPSCLMHWRLKLEEYNYKVIYKEGKQNTNADAFSRIPQISVLSTRVSTSNNKNSSYSLFLH